MLSPAFTRNTGSSSGGKRTQKGVAVLEERFNEQEAKVREAQSNVMYLQKALEIPDSMASEAGPSLLLSERPSGTSRARALKAIRTLAPGHDVEPVAKPAENQRQ